MFSFLRKKGYQIKIVNRGEIKTIELTTSTTQICEWNVNVGEKVYIKKSYCKLGEAKRSKFESLIICKLWLKYRKPISHNSSHALVATVLESFYQNLKESGWNFFHGKKDLLQKIPRNQVKKNRRPRKLSEFYESYLRLFIVIT